MLIPKQPPLSLRNIVALALPAATARKLTDEEMSVYRAPFATRESRRPTWRFPNELPIAGEPADVYALIEEAHRTLEESTYVASDLRRCSSYSRAPPKIACVMLGMKSILMMKAIKTIVHGMRLASHISIE